MSCTTERDKQARVLEAATRIARGCVTVELRCPHCGRYVGQRAGPHDDCPGAQPLADWEPTVHDEAGNVVWALSPEPAPQRIVRGPWSRPAAVWDVLDALVAAGGRPYEVGGVCRDRFLALLQARRENPVLLDDPERLAEYLAGVKSKDFDLEVHGLSPDEIVAAVRDLGYPWKVVGQRFGVVDIALPGGVECQVAPGREEITVGIVHHDVEVDFNVPSLKRACARRDTPYGALVCDPYTGEMYDFYGGMRDLEQGILRHTSPAFADDSGRPLRVMRQCSQFDLAVQPETIALSATLLGKFLAITPGQRKGVQLAEWQSWARKARRPELGLEFLRQAGWLQAFPELEALLRVPPELAHLAQPPGPDGIPQGVPQDPRHHPEGGAWRHTLLAVAAAAQLAGRPLVISQPGQADLVLALLSTSDREDVVYAALLHDTAKDETTVVEPSGQVTSKGHAARSAERAQEFLEGIGVSKEQQQRVCALVRDHMDYASFMGSERHVLRLARRLQAAGTNIEMLTRLVAADMGARPPRPAELPPQMVQLLATARRMGIAQGITSPVLTGQYLMGAFPNLVPSPFMGQVLRAAEAAQKTGAFSTVEEGLAWVREHFRLPAQEQPWPRRGRAGGLDWRREEAQRRTKPTPPEKAL